MSFLPHEPPETRSLREIPATVRRKLAEAGAQMTLVQWRGLPHVARRRLVDMPVELTVDRKAFGRLVEWLKRTFLSINEPYGGTLDEDHPWRSEEPPPIVQMQPATWCGLGVDARFALVTAETEEERSLIMAALTGAVSTT